MDKVILQDEPIKKREQILRNSCDHIVEDKYYIKKFTLQDVIKKREELSDTIINLSELTSKLEQIKAEYKEKMKPLVKSNIKIIKELKQGGEDITADVYVIIDQEEEMVGYYSEDGTLIEERPIRPEERQKTIFQEMRTGTNN